MFSVVASVEACSEIMRRRMSTTTTTTTRFEGSSVCETEQYNPGIVKTCHTDFYRNGATPWIDSSLGQPATFVDAPDALPINGCTFQMQRSRNLWHRHETFDILHSMFRQVAHFGAPRCVSRHPSITVVLPWST